MRTEDDDVARHAAGIRNVNGVHQRRGDLRATTLQIVVAVRGRHRIGARVQRSRAVDSKSERRVRKTEAKLPDRDEQTHEADVSLT
jgi:hypothetical protein